jgi:hypothetical protein
VNVVPEPIRALAKTRIGDIFRNDLAAAQDQLRALGIQSDTQLAAFFLEFNATNMSSTSSFEELQELSSPSPQIQSATRFVHEVWGLPREYVALTSCEGEGGYLYSILTGAVYDFDLATREAFLDHPHPKWKDFNTFIEWYLGHQDRES